jgi:hypothetical protein
MPIFDMKQLNQQQKYETIFTLFDRDGYWNIGS